MIIVVILQSKGEINMATRRQAYYSSLAAKRAARHNREMMRYTIKSIEDLVQQVSTTSLAEIVPALLGIAVQQAKFSDYTGVLANSYMAALFVNGQFVGNRGNYNSLIRPGGWGKVYAAQGQLTKGNEWKIKGGQFVWSSHRMPGTVLIRAGKSYRKTLQRQSYESGKISRYTGTKLKNGGGALARWQKTKDSNHMMSPIRTRRNQYSPEFFPFNKKEFNHKGYGQNLSMLKGMRGNLKKGQEIILTNGAPYRDRVNGVLPTINGLQGDCVAIVRKELERAIRQFNRKR